MTTITVDVSEAVAKLDPKYLERALKQGIEESAGVLLEDMKVYPPPPPNSTYVRTGKLGRGWGKKFEGNRRAEVRNVGVSYAKYVQDYDMQAAIHRGRWQTTEMIARKRANDIKQIIVKALERWAR